MKAHTTMADVDVQSTTRSGHFPGLAGQSVAAAARFGTAFILLTASTLKLHYVATHPALGVLHGSRWLEFALVECELLLAAWLFAGLFLKWSRRVALLTFACFAAYAFYLGTTGAASCGCFGQVEVNPRLTFGLDAAVVLLLCGWRPRNAGSPTAEQNPMEQNWRSTAIATVWGCAAFSVLMVFIGTSHDASLAASPGLIAENELVVLEPEKWIGKKFPLADHIDIGSRLLSGRWMVVLFHHDCSKCREAISQYQRLGLEGVGAGLDGFRIALIDVPPHGEHLANEGPCAYGQLSSSKQWFVATPTEIKLIDGQVTAVSDSRESAGHARQSPASIARSP